MSMAQNAIQHRTQYGKIFPAGRAAGTPVPENGGLRGAIQAVQKRRDSRARAPRVHLHAQSDTSQPGDDRDLDLAINALRRARPDLSAGEPVWAWQKWILLLAPAAFAVAAILDSKLAVFGLAAVLIVPFSCVVVLRTAALWSTAVPASGPPISRAAMPGHTPLPRYSVLVPVYDEAAIVPDLVAALSAIDYPPDRLQILLVLERADVGTRKAVAAIPLPPYMSAVIVPDGAPRTKPRALNFALHRATGDLIVIYDAEDVPDPDQLRRAAACLATDPRLGCVQAQLNVLNDTETWLTRQFAIEYTVLFDCLLPMLDRLGLPVPLGGTSNHFSRAALEEVGGWDPFNVTEDADLGVRLARGGWGVKVLTSTTWEEAPATFSAWLKQRTRWLKGWIQTYLVHMRLPRAAIRDLGWLRFLGLQVIMGGIILSALVHPWFYIAAAAELTVGPILKMPPGPLSDLVRVFAITNLVLGYVTGVALGCVAVAGRRRLHLAVSAWMMPAYWLLISLAAYRALFQLVSTPYNWEKTPHRPRATFTRTASDRVP
jgi:cellulose synthase/poly-beta-1,6-N-acetylglucosamine synthase-like glycosyltransferase